MKHQRQHQQGAVLLVTMVLLLVVTVLGVSSMSSTTLGVKMAANNKERQVVFEAAETVLNMAEQKLQDDGIDNTHIMECTSGSADCFDDQCEGGWCFRGVYTSSHTMYACEVEDSSDPSAYQVWRDPGLNVWETNSKHLEVDVTTLESNVKYIVEFMCFTQRDLSSPFDATSGNTGVPLFRFTALAENDTGDIRVALQSTYRYVD